MTQIHLLSIKFKNQLSDIMIAIKAYTYTFLSIVMIYVDVVIQVKMCQIEWVKLCRRRITLTEETCCHFPFDGITFWKWDFLIVRLFDGEPLTFNGLLILRLIRATFYVQWNNSLALNWNYVVIGVNYVIRHAFQYEIISKIIRTYPSEIQAGQIDRQMNWGRLLALVTEWISINLNTVYN